jgi:hypothetical protein
MRLKTVEVDGSTYAEIKDGSPVYVDESGKEIAVDGASMHTKIKQLNFEAMERRKNEQELKDQLEKFQDLDPDAARKAIDTVKNLDDKKLVDADQVQRIKDETAAAFQKRLDEANKEREQLMSQYAQEKLAGAFSGSKFVKERLAIPPDMVQAAFARHFEFKDGRINPRDANGNPIYSDSNPGDVASFDEALEKIVQQYPHRDSILKGSGASGSGAQPGDGNGAGVRTITRQQFSGMRPDEQQKYAAAAQKGEVRITD